MHSIVSETFLEVLKGAWTLLENVMEREAGRSPEK